MIKNNHHANIGYSDIEQFTASTPTNLVKEQGKGVKAAPALNQNRAIQIKAFGRLPDPLNFKSLYGFEEFKLLDFNPVKKTWADTGKKVAMQDGNLITRTLGTNLKTQIVPHDYVIDTVNDTIKKATSGYLVNATVDGQPEYSKNGMVMKQKFLTGNMKEVFEGLDETDEGTKFQDDNYQIGFEVSNSLLGGFSIGLYNFRVTCSNLDFISSELIAGISRGSLQSDSIGNQLHNPRQIKADIATLLSYAATIPALYQNYKDTKLNQEVADKLSRLGNRFLPDYIKPKSRKGGNIHPLHEATKDFREKGSSFYKYEPMTAQALDKECLEYSRYKVFNDISERLTHNFKTGNEPQTKRDYYDVLHRAMKIGNEDNVQSVQIVDNNKVRLAAKAARRG